MGVYWGAQSNSGVESSGLDMIFSLGVSLQLLFMVARFSLGYFLTTNKELSGVKFGGLCFLTVMSGFTGVIFAMAAIIVRAWSDSRQAEDR